MGLTLYTSQSATSCYEECPRRRWFNYHYAGKGIVSTQRSVPLVTGSCVHAGIQYIVGQYLITNECTDATLDAAVAVGCEMYRELVDNHLMGKIPDEHQAYTKLEQEALTEVLIRLWAMKEFPKIARHYHILAIEQEIAHEIPEFVDLESTCPTPYEAIMYMCKPDLILIHKETHELVNYSLKTVKGVWGFAEEAYTIANQVFTEPYFTQIWLDDVRANIIEAQAYLHILPKMWYMGKKFDAIMRVLDMAAKDIPTYTSSIRFCFLIKGNRQENPKGSKKYFTDNPFLYGYRKFTPSEIQYAWTQWTVNTQNKSGYGKLGKGWEEFATFFNQDNNVISGQVGAKSLAKDGVKAWMHALWTNAVPNDIGDGKGNVFDRYILSQPDIQVNSGIGHTRVTSLIEKEKKVLIGLNAIAKLMQDNPEPTFTLQKALDEHFPIVSGACFYPQECDYLTICPNGNKKYRSEIAADPLNEDFGPMYEVRTPHHETEARSTATEGQ